VDDAVHVEISQVFAEPVVSHLATLSVLGDHDNGQFPTSGITDRKGARICRRPRAEVVRTGASQAPSACQRQPFGVLTGLDRCLAEAALGDLEPREGDLEGVGVVRMRQAFEGKSQEFLQCRFSKLKRVEGGGIASENGARIPLAEASIQSLARTLDLPFVVLSDPVPPEASRHHRQSRRRRRPVSAPARVARQSV
jgi:hypothetical protein